MKVELVVRDDGGLAGFVWTPNAMAVAPPSRRRGPLTGRTRLVQTEKLEEQAAP